MRDGLLGQAPLVMWRSTTLPAECWSDECTRRPPEGLLLGICLLYCWILPRGLLSWPASRSMLFFHCEETSSVPHPATHRPVG